MPRPGNSRHSTKQKPSIAQPFAVRYHRGQWQARHGKNWFTADEIWIQALAVTSPDGTLTGMGVLERTGRTIRITS